MAAITSTIAAGISLAGMGMSAAQAIKSKQLAKDAENNAKAAAEQIMGLKEQNPFAAVQVPTMGTELAQQGLDRAAQSALQATQGAGAEGVIGGVGQISQGLNASELDLAAQANDLKYKRDADQATVQSDINKRQIERQKELLNDRLEGAQKARANAIENKNAAIEGMVSGGVNALMFADKAAPLYAKKKGNLGNTSALSNTIQFK